MRPKNPFRFLNFLLPTIALLAIGFVGGYKFAVEGHRIGPDQAGTIVSRVNPSGNAADFNQFWNVWDLLKKDYYDPSKLVEEKLVQGAIKGMVAAVGDPYTVYLNQSEQKVTEEDLSGSFDGVGIQLGYKGTQLAVIAPLPASPAEKAGVKPGDLIIGIKDTEKKIDKATDGVSLPEAVQMIRGPRGTKVTLALLRTGSEKAIVVELERQSIDVPSVVLSYVGADKKVAHIKVSRFGTETQDEWDKTVLDVLGKPGIKGYIIDLRNNPGGYLQAAADLATDFLEKGTLVVSEESGGVIKEQIKTEKQGRLIGEDVVVMINKGSASASEILAGALRDQKQYKLLGTTSFGKGTVQEPRQFPSGDGIHITIRKWLTPNGTWVHEKGLEPDVKVEDDTATQADEQLQKAISQIEAN